MEMPHMFVVEDDSRLSDLLVEYFGAHGFTVTLETRGDRAVDRILRARPLPEVVVLDLMLPGLEGFEVCRRLRHAGYNGRVLMLTARRHDVDHVAGLELGADDYITKPVDPRVLLARIRAVCRRTAESPQVHLLQVGALRLDRMLREVAVGETQVTLTGAEFDLLWMLAENAGQVLPRERLFREVRGVAYDGIDRTIDIHVSRLRHKLHDAGLDGDVKGVRGVGYQLAVRG